MKIKLSENTRSTQRRVRICIPKQLHQEPVISHLISNYSITINIVAAVLGANANGDGWFDLALQGPAIHVEQALTYINDLGVEVWHEIEQDGW